MKKIILSITISLIFTPFLSFASNVEQFAEPYCRQGLSASGEKAAENLAMCGRILDNYNGFLTEQAEKDCYWRAGAPKTVGCMQNWINRYNSEFGSGSFAYRNDINSILYTAMHYKTILQKYPKSKYAPEAEFAILIREIIGHPDNVLPKIKNFLNRYKRGEWNRKGLLLWARVNEDIWYIHKKWSWVLYNGQVSDDDLLIRSEPYRQEAIKTYKKLMKDKNTFEGKAAEREYQFIVAQRDDGYLYSIVNDSFAGPLGRWGITPPNARGMSQQQMAPVKNNIQQNSAPSSVPQGATSLGGQNSNYPPQTIPEQGSSKSNVQGW